jgi:hypothetical protein
LKLPVFTPSTMIECTHFRARLMARACVLRQRVQSVSRFGKKLAKVNVLSHCQSGLCTEGFLVERRLRGQHIEPPRPVNLSAYWKARKAG